MTDLNRRALLGAAGAAGAGLVLSGCNNSSPCPDGKKPGTMDEYGACSKFGDLVTDDDPSVSHNVSVGFSPSWMCGVYIQLLGNGKIMMRHGYVDIRSVTPTDYNSTAQRLMEDLKNKPADVHESKENATTISLGTQQIVVILVDNLPNDLSFNTAEEYIFRFAPISVIKPTRLIYPNFAFYNLLPMKFNNPTPHGYTPLISNSAYRLDYYNINSRLEPHTTVVHQQESTWYMYSMNIHLLISSSTNTKIPIVLDPDTGNMGSNP